MSDRREVALNNFRERIVLLINKLETRNRAAGYSDDMEDLEPLYSRLIFIRNVLSSPEYRSAIVASMSDNPMFYPPRSRASEGGVFSNNPPYDVRAAQQAFEWGWRGRRLIEDQNLSMENVIMAFRGMEIRLINDDFIDGLVGLADPPGLTKNRETITLWSAGVESVIRRIIPTLPREPMLVEGATEDIGAEETKEDIGAEETKEDIGAEETKEDEGPKCSDVVMLDEFGIKEYLREDSQNFVIGLAKPSGEIMYECQNLRNLKLQKRMDSNPRDRPPYTEFLECKDEAPARVQADYGKWLMPGGRRFVKMYSFGLMVLKPAWLWNGPVPEPRIFILEQAGDVYKFVTSEAAPAPNSEFRAVGKDHCNQTGRVSVYRLVPVTLTSDGNAPTSIGVTGGRKRRNRRSGRKTKKNNRTKTRKHRKNRKTRK
jgi:hypothetical protein